MKKKKAKRTSVRLTSAEWTSLLEKCASIGCVSVRGSKAGRPSWITLVNGIADGVYDASANAGWQKGKSTGSSGWKSLGLPITDERVERLQAVAAECGSMSSSKDDAAPSWRRLVKDIARGRVDVKVVTDE